MAIVVVDHHLKDFDSWFEAFLANPPPDIGRWWVARGTDDRNRVYVIGELQDSDVDAAKSFFSSDRMQKVFAEVNEASTTPIEFVWLEDVTPE